MNNLRSNIEKLNPLFFIIFFVLINKLNSAKVEIGKAIVQNQCSSLGENNPLRLIDCSIFKLDKGMCCLLTITNKVQNNLRLQIQQLILGNSLLHPQKWRLFHE